jgi:hypothetical protein
VIPRYQTALFVILVLASAAMGVALWQLRERAHQHLISADDSTPTQAPAVAQSEQATLLVASDADNSLLPQVQSLPLPQDPGARARVILGKLLDFYAAPDAAHPVPGGSSSIAQVFLMPAQDLDIVPAPPASSKPAPPGSKPADSVLPVAPAPLSQQNGAQSSGPQLAVVNLTGAFAASHPSGIETETLTVMSICGTLHANLPRVTQVRFLVDGQPRATLAGHADLTRVYLTADAVPTEGAHP